MAIENNYLEIQIVNHIKIVENFKATCKLASLKDDGIISKDEQKILNSIDKESDKYIAKLKKLL